MKNKKISKGPERFRYSQVIRGYFGLNGSGKTYAAVLDLLPVLIDGVKWHCANETHEHTKQGVTEGYRTVLSNIPLESEYYKPLRNFHDLITAEHSDILLDEIQGVLASTAYGDVPIQVKNWLHQLRRQDVSLSYTGISFVRALKELREVTKIATFCRGYFPVLEGESLWPSNQFFYYLVFDASELEAMELAESRKTRPMGFQWFSRFTKRALLVENMYSTFNSVSSFNSEIAPVGLCLICGGSIRRHNCSGHN